MYLIPLMPMGWQNLNTPETIQMHLNSGLWIFKPSEDFAKSIAEELNNSSIFKEAFFTNRESEGELVMRGKILSTKYDGYMYSYCLSMGRCFGYSSYQQTTLSMTLAFNCNWWIQKHRRFCGSSPIKKRTAMFQSSMRFSLISCMTRF